MATCFVFLVLALALPVSSRCTESSQTGCHYIYDYDYDNDNTTKEILKITYCCYKNFNSTQLYNVNASTVKLYDVDLSRVKLESITFSPNVTELVVTHSRKITTLGKFKPNNHLKLLDIQHTKIVKIEKDAFANLRKLISLQLESCSIKEIPPGTFDNLTDLTVLNLKDNQLERFPHFGVKNTNLEGLNLDKNDINELKSGQMDNIPNVKDLHLVENNFKVIPNSFFGRNLNKLNLTGTPLHTIEDDAFINLGNLIELYLDGTDIETFPTKGLKSLRILSLKNCKNLFSIPPGLPYNIENVTVSPDRSFLCCRFILTVKDNRGPKTSSPLAPTNSPLELTNSPLEPTNSPLKPTIKVLTQPFNSSVPFVQPTEKKVNCNPGPNEYQPCENIMGAQWLTIISFIVAPFALCGNFVVIIVFLCVAREYNVSRFLITNLAIADMCMGIYLLCLVVESVISSGEYYNHVKGFQYGASCKALGFLAMFSSELSIISLSLITVERYLTIVYALYPKRRLTMKHAVICMLFGWIFAITIALLPIFDVSSYNKVAICLPFDVDNGGATYLLFVFCFNGISFIFIAALYARIYRSVFLPDNSTPTRGHDSRVARRMAVLVLTDFVCFAPIAVAALSAMSGNNLINVAQSKYLLVFFFPLNSFMNPFLYALITKSFRRDFAAILKRCFVCGESLTGFLTTSLPARSAQSHSDIFSRTRQSLDFNTLDMNGSTNHINGVNGVAASYSKAEPSLVRFQHVNNEARADEITCEDEKQSNHINNYSLEYAL